MGLIRQWRTSPVACFLLSWSFLQNYLQKRAVFRFSISTFQFRSFCYNTFVLCIASILCTMQYEK